MESGLKQFNGDPDMSTYNGICIGTKLKYLAQLMHAGYRMRIQHECTLFHYFENVIIDLQPIAGTCHLLKKE